ncbi:MAG: DNA-deoxyinosine glycosylase [Nanoarchaeota archaeon]|nr:DNA-deoxyinosine glycosylase [Nanoarchaeota archaeon]
MIKNGLKPVYDSNTEILIVGSFPGEESLRRQEYYAYSRNIFWKLIGQILNIKLVTLPYEERLKILLKNKIGLWDTIISCERDGSLDNAIRNPVYADFSNFSNLKKICCNGNRSFESVRFCSVPERMAAISLPSTSPANAGMTMDEKIRLWRDAVK